jgi:U4/U6.U5 tri-snRNP-associated protein 1
MMLPTERLRYGISTVVKEHEVNNIDIKFLNTKRQREEDGGEINTNQSNIEPSAAEDVSTLTLEEPPLGKGIGRALELFRKRGLIGKEKFIGRNKDRAVPSNSGVSTPKTSITQKDFDLGYRDEKGRLMTQKEAFRYQCHIFHQNKPSKRKIEKKMLRDELDERNKSIDVSKSTKTLRYLKQQQQTTNLPFAVLMGKPNNNI